MKKLILFFILLIIVLLFFLQNIKLNKVMELQDKVNEAVLESKNEITEIIKGEKYEKL